MTDSMAPDGGMFQIDGIQKAILKNTPLGNPNQPKEIGARVVDEWKRHMSGGSPLDDVAFVCLGRVQLASDYLSTTHTPAVGLTRVGLGQRERV
jgi:hypothetical protein